MGVWSAENFKVIIKPTPVGPTFYEPHIPAILNNVSDEILCTENIVGPQTDTLVLCPPRLSSPVPLHSASSLAAALQPETHSGLPGLEVNSQPCVPSIPLLGLEFGAQTS